MRDQLLALYELQRIDAEALELERSGETIPQKIQELESELDTQRSELGVLNAEIEQQKTAQQELEAQASEESAKHRQWKRRLNDIKAPREYQALSRELEMGERQVRGYEESALELLAEIEEKEKVVGEKAALLKAREGEVRTTVEGLHEAASQNRQAVEKVRAGRVELLDRIPKQLSRRYEQVRERRNGIAVGLVEKGACSACHVSLRPQLVVEILRAKSVEQCPSCNRVLVHSDLIQSEADSEKPQGETEA